jgi:hypothetical protein
LRRAWSGRKELGASPPTLSASLPHPVTHKTVAGRPPIGVRVAVDSPGYPRPASHRRGAAALRRAGSGAGVRQWRGQLASAAGIEAAAVSPWGSSDWGLLVVVGEAKEEGGSGSGRWSVVGLSGGRRSERGVGSLEGERVWSSDGTEGRTLGVGGYGRTTRDRTRHRHCMAAGGRRHPKPRVISSATGRCGTCTVCRGYFVPEEMA